MSRTTRLNKVLTAAHTVSAIRWDASDKSSPNFQSIVLLSKGRPSSKMAIKWCASGDKKSLTYSSLIISARTCTLPITRPTITDVRTTGVDVINNNRKNDHFVVFYPRHASNGLSRWQHCKLQNIRDVFSPPAHARVDRACCPPAAHAARLACATDEFTATC